MEEWLKQNGFVLGNAILSGMGLAFAIGAPVKVKFRTAKKWWIVLWASLMGFYLWLALSFTASKENVILSMLVATLNGISTSAAAMLYVHLRDKGQLKTRHSVIVFFSSSF
jgi:hypothetical protein